MRILEGISRLWRRDRDNLELENPDWRELNILPQEAVTKEELDKLQDEVVNELNRMQDEFHGKVRNNSYDTAKPQSLYYFHKYIDAKFNKKNFDFDRYFFAKQNLVDRKYAEGLGDLRTEMMEYHALSQTINELAQRLQRKINQLDPDSDIQTESLVVSDDMNLETRLGKLPVEINWRKIEEK